MTRATLVACVAAALLPACATQSAVREVADGVQAVNVEVGLLRRAQDDLRRQLGESQAGTQASQTRIEVLQAVMAATVSDLERLVTQLDEVYEAIGSLREEPEETVAAAPPPAAPEPPKDARVGSAETAYASAQANFRGREYGQAVLDFLEVVTKHPSHELAPSAQYWIGEAYYLQRDYRQALIEFQKVLDWGPASAKAAEALVKVGFCYDHLREGARAQEVWRRVLREFPDSPSANQARTLLGRRGPAN